MTIETPTMDSWRSLYEAAIQIKELAPWQWMFEGQVFGVQDPDFLLLCSSLWRKPSISG